MSSYMVSKSHVDALVHAAFFGPRGLRQSQWRKPRFKDCHDWSADQMDDLGEMLVKENLSSIHACYPDTLSDPESTPGPIAQYWLRPYKHETPTRRMSVVEALKALDCYEYQSCEHPEWEKSEAFEFCRAMRDSLIGFLPGYEAAPWEWDDDPQAAAA